ncbi:MAG: MgtC/SapB family protein [Candidatus Paceibacterota bacterium]
MNTLQQLFDPLTIDLGLRLLIALSLGMMIGMERVWAHKTAGMRTYALVAMGSALFVVISEQVVKMYTHMPGINPLHLVSNILVGVGFIGTGLIVTRDSKLMGLTSATGLWVSAGIGMAVGFKLFGLAVIATALTLFIFIALWFIEHQLKKTSFFKEIPEEEN